MDANNEEKLKLEDYITQPAVNVAIAEGVIDPDDAESEGGKIARAAVTQVAAYDYFFGDNSDSSDSSDSSDAGSSSDDSSEEPVEELYDFVSYADEEATTEWARGTVKVVDRGEDYTEVEVLTNEPDPEPSLIGEKYRVEATELDPEAVYPLYDLAGDPAGIYVKVSVHETAVTEVSDEQPADPAADPEPGEE